VADGQEDGLVFPPRALEGLVTPREPVNRIVGVLLQVRTSFVRESIHPLPHFPISSLPHASLPHCPIAPLPHCLIASLPLTASHSVLAGAAGTCCGRCLRSRA